LTTLIPRKLLGQGEPHSEEATVRVRVAHERERKKGEMRLFERRPVLVVTAQQVAYAGRKMIALAQDRVAPALYDLK
jgi:hypothetical protein